MVLAQGWVTYHGSHSGFRVWRDEQKAGNTPTVLLLSGPQEPFLIYTSYAADELDGVDFVWSRDLKKIKQQELSKSIM